jgi:hypothetical protein
MAAGLRLIFSPEHVGKSISRRPAECILSAKFRLNVRRQMRLNLTFALVLVTAAIVLHAAVLSPKVSGPIPATAKAGDPSHNYPFGATHADLAKYGYREDEFFIEGFANEYTLNGLSTAVIASGPYAYKTRVIVRRPVSASKFNGTVIQEWNNVSEDSDQENDWLWSHEHLMSAGYAYIGVSAQTRGIVSPTGLKAFNPVRYGSLDMDANGKFRNAARVLSFDAFSQVAEAAKHPQEVRLLGNLKVRNVIATGHSHGHLWPYYNGIHPVARVIDGFVFHGTTGPGVRTDSKTPAFRLFSEGEVNRNTPNLPDTDYFRTWEVAGASHADWDLLQALNPLSKRDLGAGDGETKCDKPTLSRIPAHLVQDAVYDWMKVWIEQGKQPPHGPQIVRSSSGAIARDENGNALGGIRLAQIAVPTATDTGENSGGQYCNILGSHAPFDDAKLARLYPSHAAYVAAVDRITDENLKAGYITKTGAEWTKRKARESKIGVRR